VTRQDIFERAITGAGLGSFFQVIRRLLELDHDKHLRFEGREFGFLEYRGRRVRVARHSSRLAKPTCTATFVVTPGSAARVGEGGAA
jgi:hypothetical protein